MLELIFHSFDHCDFFIIPHLDYKSASTDRHIIVLLKCFVSQNPIKKKKGIANLLLKNNLKIDHNKTVSKLSSYTI